MPRRRTHYRQLFTDASGSAPDVRSSSQTPSMVPESGSAPTPPPPPPFLHANLEIKDILDSPGHDLLPRLDPRRLPNTFWFSTDNKVGRSVSDTIKAYFVEPHHNWTAAKKNGVDETWFKCFAHKWHWESGITDQVKTEFMSKAKYRLNNTVSDWKRCWEESGDDGKPDFMSSDVWKGLKDYWMNPQSQIVAAKCSASRKTVGPDGLPAVMPHTSGQTPFAGRRLQMANGGELPPMTRVFEETHRRKDGSFVDPRAESLYNDVQTKISERQSQLPQQLSPGGSSVQSTAALTTKEIDDIYEEVAPKKKGRVLGMGSIQDTLVASSSRIPAADPVELQNQLDETRQELQTTKTKLQTFESNLNFYNSLFDILAVDNPNIASLMRQHQEQQRQQPSTSAAPDHLAQQRRAVEESTDEELRRSLGL